MTAQLARRLVTCKHFRWMEGMCVNFPPLRGAVGQQVYPTSARLATTHDGRPNRLDGVIDLSNVPPGCLPDLTDPATLGCLLQLVREAYNDPTIHVQSYEGHWRVAYWNPDNFVWAYWPDGSYAAEVEALVAALDAVP